MTSLLEQAATLATVLESDDMGRERRMWGFSFGYSEHGRGGGGWLAPSYHCCCLESSAQAGIGKGESWGRVE